VTLDPAILEPSPKVRRVEHAARACIDTCLEGLELDEMPLPIPVERWIERPLGIDYGIADLSEYGPDVLGATFIDRNEILVSETRVSTPSRLRFTAAHELGHFRLHASKQTHFRETLSQGPGSPIQIERQADRFAAAFLMPADAVMPQVHSTLEYFGLDTEVCTVMLAEDCDEAHWLWRNRVLPRLTARFEVSLAAMLHRFTELRLPDGRPFLPAQVRSRLLQGDGEPGPRVVVEDGIPIPLPQEATDPK